MDLLTNAIESLQVGVEDYEANTRPRLLSAVRNIHAGILLLYKEALHRESPPNSNDALLMARIVPSRDTNNEIVYVGDGKRTAETWQIQERFEALGIGTDWKRFRRIAEVRNEVEHYYPKLDQPALQGLLSDSFLIVRNFIKDELDDDPRELLGEEVWEIMLKVSEVYEKEKRECKELLAKVNWSSPALHEGLEELRCNSCGSDLLRPESIEPAVYDVTLQCSKCGETENAESFVPKAIALALSAASYSAVKDGGETPYVHCPECGERAYVTDEQRCALCEHEAEHTCVRCGSEIPPEELESSPLCGYCDHITNKDD